MNETAVLRLGPERAGLTLVINPKDCVVCMDAAREVAFGCGHFVCCAECAANVQAAQSCPACPIYRAPIEAVHAEAGARSHMINTLVNF